MVSEGQDRTGQVWKLQVGSGQVGIGQVRIGQVGAGQVGTSQVGKFYVRTVQIGTTEVGTVEYFESSWNLENLELECGPAQPDLSCLFSVLFLKTNLSSRLRSGRWSIHGVKIQVERCFSAACFTFTFTF